MDTINYWKGEGGDAYTKRNRVDWQARIPFWKMILDKTGARSVFEFGCGAGWNLSAIGRCYPDVAKNGFDINVSAIEMARRSGLGASDLSWYDAELTFTAGVLIHIPPEELNLMMTRIIDSSSDYILAIEYYADEETEIEYRGEMGLLWKRDYVELYQDRGLELIDSGYPAEGFDDCTWWLLRK